MLLVVKLALLITLVAVLLFVLGHRNFNYGGTLAVGSKYKEKYSSRLRPLSGPAVTTTTVDVGGKLQEIGYTLLENGGGRQRGQPNILSKQSKEADYSAFHYNEGEIAQCQLLRKAQKDQCKHGRGCDCDNSATPELDDLLHGKR